MKHRLVDAWWVSLCRERTPKELEGDPGGIILFNSPHEMDLTLKLPVVANIPHLRPGKKHYLPIGYNIAFSFSLPPPHSSPSTSLSSIKLVHINEGSDRCPVCVCVRFLCSAFSRL